MLAETQKLTPREKVTMLSLQMKEVLELYDPISPQSFDFVHRLNKVRDQQREKLALFFQSEKILKYHKEKINKILRNNPNIPLQIRKALELGLAGLKNYSKQFAEIKRILINNNHMHQLLNNYLIEKQNFETKHFNLQNSIQVVKDYKKDKHKNEIKTRQKIKKML